MAALDPSASGSWMTPNMRVRKNGQECYGA